MKYPSLDRFLSEARAELAKGPTALILAEDPVEVESTLRHHLALGFAPVVLFAPDDIELAAEIEASVHRVTHDTTTEGTLTDVVNKVIAAASGAWVYYCFNGEYLFYPFAESRSIRDMLAFHAEERRSAVLSYVIDLYAADLERFPAAVALEDAHFDRSGYYALGRADAANQNHPKERQLDFYGGLHWRFEEHIPPSRRRIDRIALFRARPGLRLRDDFTLTDEEMNTYACQWHHSITTAIMSFRTAKALRGNAGSMFDIHDFRWPKSTRFEWRSQQLLDLGLIEPGQWF